MICHSLPGNERFLDLAQAADSVGPLAGVTPDDLVAQVHALGKPFRFEHAAEGLVHTPLLALTADDGLAPDTDDLVRTIQARGGHNVAVMHAATDHSWSDHRIALETTIMTWLTALDR